jgi:4-hydroxybenzoate polyprenyltransferase
LFSVPSTFGVTAAFWLARLLHLAMLGLLVWLALAFSLGHYAMIGIAAVALLLLYEHLIVSPGDLRRLNAAFFTLNGVISVVYFLFIAMDLLVRR